MEKEAEARAKLAEYLKTHTVDDVYEEYRLAYERNEQTKRDWEALQHNTSLVQARKEKITKRNEEVMKQLGIQMARKVELKEQTERSRKELMSLKGKYNQRLQQQQAAAASSNGDRMTAEEAEKIEMDQLKQLAMLDDKISEAKKRLNDRCNNIADVIEEIKTVKELKVFVEAEIEALEFDRQNCKADIERLQRDIKAIQADISRQRERLKEPPKDPFDPNGSSLFAQLTVGKKDLEAKLKAALLKGTSVQRELRRVTSEIEALQNSGHARRNRNTRMDIESVCKMLKKFEKDTDEMWNMLRICHKKHVQAFDRLRPKHSSELSMSFLNVHKQMCDSLMNYELQIDISAQKFKDLKARFDAAVCPLNNSA